jgi:hypothetical protein
MRRILILLFTLTLSNLVIAEEPPLIYCSMSGYFEGEGNLFYKDLVTGLVAQNNLSSNPLCTAGEKRGKAAALYYKEHGQYKDGEGKYIAQQAILYKAKIRAFINKGIGL